jgi:hypothetical protein
MKNNRPVQSNISYHMILPPSSSATRGTASVSAHLETAESSGAHELQPLAHSGHPASIGAAVLRLSPEDVAHLQTNGTVPLNAQSVDAMAQNVPALDTMASAAVVDMDAVVAQLPTHDQQVARDTQQTLRELMVAHDPHERNATLERLATPETRCLLAEFTAHLNRVDEARNREGHFGDRDESEMQAESVSVLSRYLLRNEGTGTLPRLAGNALATGVRAGIGTFVGTLARNFGAFSLQKMINAARATNDGTMPAATRSMVNWMGAGMLALPVVLHIAGGIRDAINGTATRESTTDRFAHSIFALGATALAAATDSYDAVVAWHLAVRLPPATTPTPPLRAMPCWPPPGSIQWRKGSQAAFRTAWVGTRAPPSNRSGRQESIRRQHKAIRPPVEHPAWAPPPQVHPQAPRAPSRQGSLAQPRKFSERGTTGPRTQPTRA